MKHYSYWVWYLDIFLAVFLCVFVLNDKNSMIVMLGIIAFILNNITFELRTTRMKFNIVRRRLKRKDE